MKLRAKYETTVKAARPWQPWKQINPSRYEAAIAAAGYHPLTLDDLISELGPSPCIPSPALAWVCATSVVEVAQNLDDCSQPWNTYADGAAKLAVLIEYTRMRGSRGVLSEDECQQIEQNIKAFLP